MLVRHVLSAVLFGIGSSVVASQLPLNSKFQTYDTGLLNQVDDIRALSSNGFTTLRHPMYPRHSVRIKQNGAESCDNSVKSVFSLDVLTENSAEQSLLIDPTRATLTLRRGTCFLRFSKVGMTLAKMT